jgi:hypothetical protein
MKEKRLEKIIDKKIKESESLFTKNICNNLKISLTEYNNQKIIQSSKIDIMIIQKKGRLTYYNNHKRKDCFYLI